MDKFDKIVTALWLFSLPVDYFERAAGIPNEPIGPWWLSLAFGLAAALLAYRMARRVWRHMPSREECEERDAAMERRHG